MEKRNQRNNILMQLLSSALFCSAHPVVLHQLPQVINQRELLWIYLMERERETHEACYLWRELQTSMRPDRTMNVFFLTALLSSFLMVDLPHRALTPSTATAMRKSDSGCPLCSLSSFITAPTTSLLLFTRVIPYGRKHQQKPEYNVFGREIKGS